MGILARYLDLLPADARRRVLQAQQWTTEYLIDEKGARNLMGHAEDWSWPSGQVPACGAPAVFWLRGVAGDELWTDEPRLGLRFRRLVRRCGVSGAVCLIRHRLAPDDHAPLHGLPRPDIDRAGE